MSVSTVERSLAHPELPEKTAASPTVTDGGNMITSMMGLTMEGTATASPTVAGSSSGGAGSTEPDTTPLITEESGSETPHVVSSGGGKTNPLLQYFQRTSIRRLSTRSLVSARSHETARTSRNADADELFSVSPELAPAIGGCVELQEAHSEFLLPPEVALFEPSDQEIFCGGNQSGGNRQIFLNIPLLPVEQAALADLHAGLQNRYSGGRFPAFMKLHALRMLQQCKYDANRTISLMQTHLSERVARLPVCEAEVLQDLHSGFMYWHGRDRKCRPCLVIRLERIGEMVRDKERAVRLVIFVLEYAVRHAMVPGRVENWVVLLDLSNVMGIISPLHLASCASTAAAIAVALEKVYCGRMVWIKMVNMPGQGMLRNVVNGAIPADKKKKVMFPKDMSSVAQEFDPNQLEKRYGGAAPDLEPGGTYPFRFFPGCTGPVAAPAPELTGAEHSSLHNFCSRHFHEGQLWDDSLPETKARYLHEVRLSSLTPAAAQAASELLEELGEPLVTPCRDVTYWLELASSVKDLGQEKASISRFGSRARAVAGPQVGAVGGEVLVRCQSNAPAGPLLIEHHAESASVARYARPEMAGGQVPVGICFNKGDHQSWVVYRAACLIAA
eukprot:CAMPEP_0195158492 /NCGR_PEP_ID=MMETSP0448-20130528/185695_1 /TAXON_ID=66468 /ORGANISM="Heterocapsa triquestra, Strain CCMP 448" /LENGTH=614 /DNA_ID=CAMNT_0040197291 /DNA_START=183 /DNA_END=2028 /DNA_ORIENTATION=+